MKVLLVGSGGREHALAWKLAGASGLTGLHAAPGNPGIAALGDCHPVRADDAEALLGLARSLDVDLAVIGPEAPLVAGVGDALRRNGIPVFGPGRAAARIEGSKSFAKDVMASAGVPTAEALAVARPPCVVKVDGLAAGKGVFICETAEQLDEGLRAASAYDGPIVIEELLAGDEISVFALSDGQRVVPARARTGLQADRRRRHGAEHRRDGLVLARARLRAERGRGAGRADPPARGRGARPPRGAVRRRPLRRADADGVRAEGARVQRPLRRSGDAVDPAAPRRRPARRARRGGGRRSGRGSSSPSPSRRR